MSTNILVTGSAGFIGFHVSKSLLDLGYSVVGVDALTDYYDINLKISRLNILKRYSNFYEVKSNILDEDLYEKSLSKFELGTIIHLAAQAGVRYSIDHPETYVNSNIIGTFKILEFAKSKNIKHLLCASTSSVYGSNRDMPFHENQKCDTQLSFYAATKKSTEVMAHSYSHIYNMPITIFRFFTVYGPWGRPDMALFKFTKSILDNLPIDIYNFGKMKRDFTYIKDLVDSILKLIKTPPLHQNSYEKKIKNDSLSDVAPFRIVNIGNSNPVNLMDYINCLETILNKKAKKNMLEMQIGDVEATWADNKLLEQLINYKPKTKIQEGVKNFVSWYLSYYN